MKDFLWQFGPALLGIVSALIGGGIGGLIPLAIAGVVMTIVGIVIRNKIKAWQFSNAHKEQNDQAVKDHADTQKKDQDQSISDAKALEQHKKDWKDAFKGGDNA